MGSEGAVHYWQTAHSQDFDLILIDRAGQVTISPGLTDRISLTDGSQPHILERS